MPTPHKVARFFPGQELGRPHEGLQHELGGFAHAQASDPVARKVPTRPAARRFGP